VYQYLQSWDGKSHKEYILGLLSFLPLRGFEGMHQIFELLIGLTFCRII
jgi:hypothetical protein